MEIENVKRISYKNATTELTEMRVKYCQIVFSDPSAAFLLGALILAKIQEVEKLKKEYYQCLNEVGQ